MVALTSQPRTLTYCSFLFSFSLKPVSLLWYIINRVLLKPILKVGKQNCNLHCHYITETRLFKYIEHLTTKKTENFQIKKSDIFSFSAQNIDCGYSLETPRPAQNIDCGYSLEPPRYIDCGYSLEPPR